MQRNSRIKSYDEKDNHIQSLCQASTGARTLVLSRHRPELFGIQSPSCSSSAPAQRTLLFHPTGLPDRLLLLRRRPSLWVGGTPLWIITHAHRTKHVINARHHVLRLHRSPILKSSVPALQILNHIPFRLVNYARMHWRHPGLCR